MGLIAYQERFCQFVLFKVLNLFFYTVDILGSLQLIVSQEEKSEA